MKILATFALIALTGCSSPLATIGRLFPDGASGSIDEINMQASMTGSGSMVIKGVHWVGTNGFPLPCDSTNSVSSTSVTTRLRR